MEDGLVNEDVINIKSSQRLVFGAGINDADYVTQRYEELPRVGGKRMTKRVWCCPFYIKWKAVLERCYSEKWHKRFPNYRGCTVSEDWKLFSNFREWMVQQDWEGKELDKDILFVGNRIYSAETCVFIDQCLNKFVTDSRKVRGEWPIGVTRSKSGMVFIARCANPFTGVREFLGTFRCPWEANAAWLKRKLELSYDMAAIQKDNRVAEAIIDRYKNYKTDKVSSINS